MTGEKKIFLDRTDTLQVAVDKVLAAKAERVVLNVPRQSVLGESVHNFQILKRESETAGKELTIESIDEHVLELSGVAKIAAKNPIFKTKERTVMDIIPKLKTAPVEQVKTVPIEEPIAEGPKPRRGGLFARKEREPKVSFEEIEPAIEPEEPEELASEPEKPVARRKRSLRLALTLAIFLVVLGVGYALATFVLPHATITLTIQKTPFDFNDTISVSASATTPVASGAGITLPGEMQTAQNSLVMTFPATGSANVSSKAGGMLTVYNAYSSAAQTLVAQTRFESPDGKIFKSTKTIVVPGAKVTSGAIVPSSVAVAVLADAPGPDYNVGPSSHWTIPGFQGTPRYDKFYADATAAMTGGASGTVAIATKDDVTAAEAKIEAALKDSLTGQIGLLGEDKFKVLPGASSFTITKESTTTVGADGGFSVLVSGTMREMVFDEGMLKSALISSAGASSTAVTIDELKFDYGSTTLALDKGLMAFKLTGDLVYEPSVDVSSVKGEIAGQDEASLKTIVFGITGLQKANISFWPFWVTKVPEDQTKIELNLN